MNLGEKLVLGLDTTVISMGIVFLVLIALAVLISIQYRILKALGVISDKMDKPASNQVSVPAAVPASVSSPAAAAIPGSAGLTKGEARLVGVEDEEIVAVVMAAVSHASSIPLSELRIRSIKRVDENWSNTAKQEMANQRL